MNKQKIINEIFEITPDLEKEQIKKIVTTLDKSNPLNEIKIETYFKNSLKTKLEEMGGYEKRGVFSKFSKSFVFLFTPILGVIGFFTIIGIFGSNFITNDNKNIILIQTGTLESGSSQVLIEDEKVFFSEDSLNNLEEISTYSSVDNNLNIKNNLEIQEPIKPDQNVLDAVIVPENNLTTQDIEIIQNTNVNIKASGFSDTIQTNSLDLDLGTTSDKEFNNRVLQKVPVGDTKRTIEMKYLDDPNLLRSSYDENLRIYEVEPINNNLNIDIENSGEEIIIGTKSSDFERVCKQRGFNYLKDGDSFSCKFEEKICIESNYYIGKCSFLN